MDAHFLLRRIHSLTGVVPVGIFLTYHLFLQTYLHTGAEAYNARVNSFYESPLAIWILIFVVYIPLFFHSFFGVKLAMEAKVQSEYKYYSHLLYWLQRLSGIGVLFFIFGHLYNAKLVPLLTSEWGAHHEHLVAGFANPATGMVTKTVYLLGILGATFHFANGINTFCITWGIALTPKSQAIVRQISIVVFLILLGSAMYGLSAIW
jgi:succinate dehydrogenase / fumarate reductase cytochrome b subunit